MSTTIEHLRSATFALSCCGTIKERLIAAYRAHLAGIECSDLPRELADDVLSLCGELVRERPLSRGEDAVQATVRKMSNEEAAEVARRVVMLFGDLCAHHSVQHRASGYAQSASVVHINRA